MSVRSKISLAILLCISGLLSGQENEPDTSGYLPLFWYNGALEYNFTLASSKGYDKEVERMIRMGADVNYETSEGATPLFFAVSNNHPDVVSILLSNGADPNKQGRAGDTPLLLAVWKNNIHIAEMLIRNGADINYQDPYGATALHYASIYNFFELTDMLLYYDADVNMKSTDGTSPLMAAIWAGHVDVADLLIRHGANMAARDRYGFTPFLIAAQNGDTLLMNILLKEGVDIYEKNIYNWDALSLTIKSDQKNATEMLLTAGDRWTDPDREVINPYSIAARYRRRELIKLLEESGLPGNYRRSLDQVAVSVSSRFTLKDFYSGFNFSFKEPLGNFGLTTGFDTKLWETKILVKQTENLFFQYYDKSSLAYAGIFRDFPLTDNILKSNLALTASLYAGFYFGNKFKGTEIAPENKFKLIPSATLKWLRNNFVISGGVEYINSDYYKIGPLWCRIGCSYNFYLDNVKAPLKIIKWY